MNTEKLSYPTKSSNDVEMTDFARILEALKTVSVNEFDLVNSLTNLANSVKDMVVTESNELEVKEKSPSCLVDYLWDEIWNIKRSNAQLEKVVLHLQRTIGR